MFYLVVKFTEIAYFILFLNVYVGVCVLVSVLQPEPGAGVIHLLQKCIKFDLIEPLVCELTVVISGNVKCNWRTRVRLCVASVQFFTRLVIMP